MCRAGVFLFAALGGSICVGIAMMSWHVLFEGVKE